MTRPLVSVVISTFNYGRYLPQTLASILSQGLPPSELEVLVYDDASTDDTESVLRPFADRIRCRRLDGIGLVPTLNLAFREARGELICPIDADDMWTPGRLSQVTGLFAREPDLGAVTHGACFVDSEGRPLGLEVLPPAVGRWTLEDLLKAPLKPGHLSCVSFRRSVLEQLLPIPGGRRFALPDALLFTQSVFLAPAGVIPKPLALYRQHGDNWSDRLGRMKADLRQLEVGWGSQHLLDAELRRALRRRSLRLSWSAAEVGERLEKRLECLALLNAHRGRGARARRLSLALLRRLGPRQRLFKGAALGLAASWPALYRGLHLAYRALRRSLRGDFATIPR